MLTNFSPQNVAKHIIVALVKPFEEKITLHLNTTCDIDTPFDEIKTEEQEKIRTLLNKQCNLFKRKETNNIASNVVNQIDAESTLPIHCSPQRLSFQKREHIHSQVANMLKNNFRGSKLYNLIRGSKL